MTNIHKVPCASLLNEELKWKEKVDALDTAIEIYITRGHLHNSKNVVIPSGGPLCTTDYDVPTGRGNIVQPFMFKTSLTYEFLIKSFGGVIEPRNNSSIKKFFIVRTFPGTFFISYFAERLIFGNF